MSPLAARMFWRTVTACGVLACSGGTFAGDWVEKTHPLISGKDEVLRAIKGFTTQDVWTAGYVWGTVGGAIEFRTRMLHWNGAAWSVSPTRDVESAPALNILFGLDGSGTSDLWTVGYYRDSNFIDRSLLEHWNGTAWTIVPAPHHGTGHNVLQAVSAPRADHAWAVGNATDPAYDYGPLALHWNGSWWSDVPVTVPAFCRRQIDLTGVATLPGGAALLTGHCLTTAGRQGFVLRYAAGQWRLSAGPKVVPENSQLFAVTWTGGPSAWAVGIANNTALTLRMTAGVWSVVPADAAGRDSALASVSARTSSDIWAVGNGQSSQPPFAGRLALHWDGTAWTRAPAGDFGSLNGVDMTGPQSWAAGQEVADSLIMWRRD